ncbi:DUF2163 domain-containing protein [Ruegeria sp. 2012CJ41-6]|uniref:DUF2163 domain-containing protein n=1 Tax=Ruegeria spongiae TaxID=2942209 RepID=A0ABT0PZW2_9RHOB|nr:DUF2163 domain-containing protein [Ruegeria spongiae]MCL6283100.1 DUF2163 domain-containing protein [Ruegeria spongiae]
MAGLTEELQDHLESGLTTLSRCWEIRRKDGTRHGFTDHDCDLEFDGLQFRADTGLTAAALQQGTGLSVDNSEAVGALSDASIRAEDIEAGRYDGAEVTAWLVNWANPQMRLMQFRGALGELRQAGGAFQAELRGLTDQLNRPLGRVFQKPCTAVLGDRSCGFDLDKAGYATALEVVEIEEGVKFRWGELPGFAPAWFERGRLDVLDGAAKGLWGTIKTDRIRNGHRQIELWEPLRAAVASGDRVRLVAGCDKRMETCRMKFNNLLNFQGFPDLPGEDWLMAVPKRSGSNKGGSRR